MVKKKITHDISKITIRRARIDELGWDKDGYEETSGFNVQIYRDGYYSATVFVNKDFDQITGHLQRLSEAIKFYEERETAKIITRREYNHLVFLKEEKDYYQQLLADLEKTNE